jgi:hypothetical protein
MKKEQKSSKSVKKPTEREKLLKELRSLIKDIPEDGLLYLIKQANTILYNVRVDELNIAGERLDRRAGGKPRNVIGESPLSSTVTVERGAFGRSFILDINGTRKTLGEDEMSKMVKITHSAEDTIDGATRLHRWIKRNRDDILLDASITGPKHPSMRGIFECLTQNFSLNE